MSRSVAAKDGSVEVRRSDEALTPSVRKTDCPIQSAKARVGQAITAGFGARARKEFGDTSQMARVESGAGVPDYLARIYADPEAKYRFGVQWFDGDADVETSTTITIKRKRTLPARTGGQLKKLLTAENEEE